MVRNCTAAYGASHRRFAICFAGPWTARRPALHVPRLAAALLSACEAWAASMGCSEFAGDCEWDDLVGQRFRARLGDAEADRIVCYTKGL